MICLPTDARTTTTLTFDLVSALAVTGTHASYFNRERPFHSPTPSSSSHYVLPYNSN